VLGANCEGLCIDFPAYYFDPQSGVLTIYPPDPTLVLADDEIGYVGSGESLSGVGCGAYSGLTRIRRSEPGTRDYIAAVACDSCVRAIWKVQVQ
jgi:hypothetical protein